MSRFTSTRERRLWLYTAVVLATIYATLGVAGTLAGMLRETGLLTVAFVAAMLLAGATVLTQALRVRPGGAELAVGLGIATVYLLLATRMATAEERSHLIEYSVVGAFVYAALAERARHVTVPLVPLLAVVLAALAGVVDECLQLLSPRRVFDPVDIVFNVLASSVAVGGCVSLRWVRERCGRRE